MINGKDYAKADDLDGLDFSSQLRSEIAFKILQLYDESLSYDGVKLTAVLGEDYLTELNLILLRVEEIYCTDGNDKYYKDCLRFVKRSNLESDIKYLQDYCKAETEVDKQMKIIVKIQQKSKLLFQLKTEDKI